MKNATIGLLAVLLATAGCGKVFKWTWEKPYTTDSRVYHSAYHSMCDGKFWKDYMVQFPKFIPKADSVDFFYLQGNMQGGSVFMLGLQFSTQQKAERFFDKQSKSFVKEFEFTVDTFREVVYVSGNDTVFYYKQRFGDFCAPRTFDSLFSEYSTVRFIDTSICSSNGSNSYLGGIISCIAIHHKKKRVYCWTEDARL